MPRPELGFGSLSSFQSPATLPFPPSGRITIMRFQMCFHALGTAQPSSAGGWGGPSCPACLPPPGRSCSSRAGVLLITPSLPPRAGEARATAVRGLFTARWQRTEGVPNTLRDNRSEHRRGFPGEVRRQPGHRSAWPDSLRSELATHRRKRGHALLNRPSAP